MVLVDAVGGCDTVKTSRACARRSRCPSAHARTRSDRREFSRRTSAAWRWQPGV